jgi:hypothetical protein
MRRKAFARGDRDGHREAWSVEQALRRSREEAQRERGPGSREPGTAVLATAGSLAIRDDDDGARARVRRLAVEQPGVRRGHRLEVHDLELGSELPRVLPQGRRERGAHRATRGSSTGAV